MTEILEKIWLQPSEILTQDRINGVEVQQTVLKITQVMFFQAYFLFVGADLISEGSELLLLTPYKDLIGTIVIPILGAVPEGFMVLFSGLGKNPMETASIGIGTLAGSSIMLLTINWAVVIFGGRVDVNEGRVDYKTGLTRTQDVFKTGCENSANVKKQSYPLIASVVPLCIIEFASIRDIQGSPSHDSIIIPLYVSIWITLLLFIVQLGQTVYEIGESQNTVGIWILSIYRKNESKVDKIVNKVFDQYSDGKDNISKNKLIWLLKNMGFKDKKIYDMKDNYDFENCNKKVLENILSQFIEENKAKLENIELEPLYKKCIEIELVNLVQFKEEENEEVVSVNKESLIENGNNESSISEESEEEDENLLPEHLKDSSQCFQQTQVVAKSLFMMGLGAFVVMVFSDPTVSCFDTLGDALGIENFQIAFFLAPIASNAKEWVASQNQASKKTKETYAIAVNSLQGSSFMNTTQCLMIFLALILQNPDMSWSFHAETLVTIVIILLMALQSHRKVTQLWESLFVGLVYFISIILIYCLKHQAGWA